MSERTRNLVIGLASIVGMIGLAGLLFMFGELDRWVHPTYIITFDTNDASGMRPGSTIELRGVPIGQITRLQVFPATEFGVRMTAEIEHGTAIPADVVAYATTPLIGAAAMLQLEQPKQRQGDAGEDIAFLATDGSAVIIGELRSRILEQITQALDERTKPITDALADFRTLSASLTNLSDNVNELLQPQSQADLEGGAEPNLRTAIARMNHAVDVAGEALKLARDWLADENLRLNVTTSVEKASSLIDQASTAIGEYQKLAVSLNQRSDEVVKKLLPAADQLSLTLEEIQRLVRLAREGEGSVGRLLNQPDLYNNLNDTAVRLQRVLEEVQMLIEKLKAEGVRINL